LPEPPLSGSLRADGTKLFDEAGARQLIDRWQTSDLSDSAFARRERVRIRLLRRWRDLFEEEPAEDLRLIPVVIRESDDAERRATAPFVVDLPGGASVRVAAGFDATELRRLVETLEDTRC